MAGNEDWVARIRTLAESLLTLEVNTIEKPNMSAAKMPDMPLALHNIARLYADELADRKWFVTDELLALAQARLEADAAAAAPALAALEAWTARETQIAAGAQTSVNITNGPRTFEALVWAARAARHELDGAPASPEVAIDRTLLSRIIVNAQELRQMSLLMLTEHRGLPDAQALFDGTLEQTTAVLFRRPRPNLDIDTDILVFVRKAWDIGLERVMFQTSMQVDGDVLVRVAADLDPAKRIFYSELHRATVDTALRRWQGLFDLAANLVGSVGKALFGPKV